MSALWLAQVGSPYVGHGFPPHWGWYIVLYFFLGGLAAGTYVIATLLLFAGDAGDRDAIRLGYSLAFPLVLVCAALLILDLGVPSRFWHMVVQSERIPALMFKPWSPISLGVWILTAFGVFASAAFAWALTETGRLRWPPAQRALAWAGRQRRPLALAWNAAGVCFGFGLAGYTGVLVSATTIPVWHEARLMGALFLVSALSSSYALLRLLLRRRPAPEPASLARLARGDRFTMVLELVLIALMLLILGRAAAPLISGGFGVVFWVGAVGLGVVLPLALQRSDAFGWPELSREMVGAMCVLAGGLLLRFVVVMSPQYPAISPWSL